MFADIFIQMRPIEVQAVLHKKQCDGGRGRVRFFLAVLGVWQDIQVHLKQPREIFPFLEDHDASS